MNRRGFLKAFTSGVAATAVVKVLDSTPLVKTLIEAKKEVVALCELYEVQIDRFNIYRFPKIQLMFRHEALKQKGYILNGNRFSFQSRY